MPDNYNKYGHIRDCWVAIREAKTKTEVLKLFDEFPRWSGEWEIEVEDDHYVVVNIYYDELYNTYDSDYEILDIEVLEEE